MLTTTQICDNLRGVRYFLGAFPADADISVPSYPATIIFNTDPHGERGEHWIAIHLKGDGEADYCDSFGFPPLVPQTQAFLFRLAWKKMRYNMITIQSPSETTCGNFAIDFVRHVSAGGSLESFVASKV